MTEKIEKLEKLKELVNDLGLKTANHITKNTGLNYHKAVQLDGITIDNIRFVITK